MNVFSTPSGCPRAQFDGSRKPPLANAIPPSTLAHRDVSKHNRQTDESGRRKMSGGCHGQVRSKRCVVGPVKPEFGNASIGSEQKTMGAFRPPFRSMFRTSAKPHLQAKNAKKLSSEVQRIADYVRLHIAGVRRSTALCNTMILARVSDASQSILILVLLAQLQTPQSGRACSNEAAFNFTGLASPAIRVCS